MCCLRYLVLKAKVWGHAANTDTNPNSLIWLNAIAGKLEGAKAWDSLFKWAIASIFCVDILGSVGASGWSWMLNNLKHQPADGANHSFIPAGTAGNSRHPMCRNVQCARLTAVARALYGLLFKSATVAFLCAESIWSCVMILSEGVQLRLPQCATDLDQVLRNGLGHFVQDKEGSYRTSLLHGW